MPSPDEILAPLTELANQWQALAVAWHLYFAVVAATAMVQRPSRRLVAILLSVPLVSVSLLAWTSGSAFNAVVFAAVAVTLLVLASRLPDEPVQLAPPWLLSAGAVVATFGWLYPHFLVDTPLAWYLVAAPTGVVPCPTLAIVIGISVMLDGLGARGWGSVLGAAGIAYGLFGALRLGVTLDLALLAGAVVLVIVAQSSKATKREREPTPAR